MNGKRLRSFWSLLGLTGILAGTGFSSEMAEPIWVDHIPVRPGGNLIFEEGRLELHPKLLIGLGYDSNVDAVASGAEEDAYARGVAGLLVYWLPAIADRFSADVQVDARRYLERDDRDFTGGWVRLGWTRESAVGPLATVTADGMLVDDPLIETGRQVQRARYEGQTGWWMRGASNAIRLGAGVIGEDFLENAGVFDEHERDYLRPQAAVEWWHGQAAGPTRFGLRVMADQLHYHQSDSDYQDGTGVAVTALVTHYFAPLLQLNGHIGVEHRQYDDDFAHNSAFDDQTITRPIGELLLRWDPEEYSRVDVGVASRVIPTVEANAAFLLHAWVHSRLRLRRTFGVLAEVDLYDLQRSGTAVGEGTRDKTFRLRAGIEVWARDGLVIRALGGADFGEPEERDGYTRTVASIDTAFAW